ncbi:SDR family NAD(P)-dependent oxidoreductase [Achromobacter sp. DMS1]|uniref:SDR family NAD(P)-dependent oxidoreductase n=1 Tax=Achromobacter sp. DMS1 TaxID=1688405 RepID=UPI000A7F2C09|nr:SDR family oxidoreductase [Achromobacter sp. DMS1]
MGVNDLKQELVDDAVAAIEAAGGKAFPVVRNVATREGIAQAVRQAAEHGSRFDILVNNAAWVRYQHVPDIMPETLDRMLDIGFKAVVWGMQAAAEAMDGERGGAIVNVASTAALKSAPGSVVYSGIKAGVLGITRAAAAELGARGIRVNAVALRPCPPKAPSATATPNATPGASRARPWAGLGTVDDVAGAIAFLASDEARFITAQALVVDGGITFTTL